MFKFSKRVTQATRDRGVEIIRQARRGHVNNSILIERGYWITYISIDPLVIHIIARLTVGHLYNGETRLREGL